MPRVRVRIYCRRDGRAPLISWLDRLEEKARFKCIARIERLQEQGHELVRNRNEAAYLRDGIYELRVRRARVNLRILYFFCGNEVVILSHGLKKEQVVPPKEIDLAVKRRAEYEANPALHTYRGDING